MSGITKIVKRDGRLEDFNAYKIKEAINKAFLACIKDDELSSNKLGLEDLENLFYSVVDDLKEKFVNDNPPSVEEIQDIVEKKLIEFNYPEIAKKYIIYRSERSKEREKHSSLMNTFKEISLLDSKESDLKRECGNVNGDTAMGTMLQYGSEASKAFNRNFLLKKEVAEAFSNNYLHIHDFEYYNMTTTCCQIDLAKLFKGGFHTGHGALREPSGIRTACALTAIAFQSNQNDQHGGQSIPHFDYYMAPYISKSYTRYFKNNIKKYLKFYCEDILKEEVLNSKIKEVIDSIDKVIELKNKNKVVNELKGKIKKVFEAELSCDSIDKFLKHSRDEAMVSTEDETYQGMESLIHNLNTMHSRGGAQVVFSSINFGTDTSEEGRMAIKNFLLSQEQGLGHGETAIFPISIFKVKEGVNYNKEDPNYDLFRLACRVSANRMFPNFEFIDAPFNLQYYDPKDYNTEVATMGCVENDSISTFKYDGNVYLFTFEKAWEFFSKKFNIEQKETDICNWIDLDGVLIYDSHSKRFVDCYRLIRNKTKTGLEIKTKRGRFIKVTEDHPLDVVRDDVKLGRTYSRDIKVGDKIEITSTKDNISMKQSWSEYDLLKAWLYGIVICDSYYKSSINVSGNKDIINKFINIVKIIYGNEVKVVHRNRGSKGVYDSYRIVGDQKHIRQEFLNAFGSYYKKERTIPVDVFNWSIEEQKAFLCGMIDAEGYFDDSRGNNNISLGSSNYVLSMGQFQLAKNLGLNPRIIKNHYNKNNLEKIRYVVLMNMASWMKDYLASEKFNKIDVDKEPIIETETRYEEVIEVLPYTFKTGYVYDVTTETERFDVDGISSWNCRTRVMANVYDPTRQYSTSRGNLSFTSINLPKIALESNKDINKFYETLDHYIDLAIEQLLDRMEIQSKRRVYNHPFLMGQGVWMDSDKLKWDDEVRETLKHGTLSVGFVGLAETLVALIGKHHGESEEAQKLGLEIVKHMRKRMDDEAEKRKLNFSLLATPAESLAGRLIKKDQKQFGKIKGITDKEYYTNSFHIPVYYEISSFDKIKKEAPYHAIANAGHITYIEVDGNVAHNIDAFEKIVRAMKEAGIGYGAINHPLDYDPVCGYSGVIGEVCPKCGRHDKDGVNPDISRIRRITGYLVGSVHRFNDGKKAEERDRVKHMKSSV